MDTILKRFESADEIREFDLGGWTDMTIAGQPGTYSDEPGGGSGPRHVGPSQSSPCDGGRDLGIVLAGYAVAAALPTADLCLTPGTIFHIPQDRQMGRRRLPSVPYVSLPR